MMKFEGGYAVETVFDGSKLGIDPYSVEVSPFGELLVLDSENSNIYKISTPLSRCKSRIVYFLTVWTCDLFHCSIKPCRLRIYQKIRFKSVGQEIVFFFWKLLRIWNSLWWSFGNVLCLLLFRRRIHFLKCIKPFPSFFSKFVNLHFTSETKFLQWPTQVLYSSLDSVL